MEEEKTKNSYNLSSETCRVTLNSSKSVSYGSNGQDNPICDMTSETFPRMHNYTDKALMKRPSLGELHGDYITEKGIGILPGISEIEKAPEEFHGFKLGWIQGVLIPCLLNIWGVMLFLRMPWIVAESGIFQATVIIVISTIICGLTTLSLSALCTNGVVKGGGIYFIISRSLGAEFGASVGIVLAFANAVSASLNTIGFCESLNDLVSKYGGKILDGDVNAVRLVGCISIVIMILICCIGIEWESKAQNILIALILIAMADFFVGTAIGPQNDLTKISEGFVGYNWTVFTQNWVANYRPKEGTDHSFFTIFAIFFPSVTGIQAGANISGDLKDPSSAIPKGTLLSLLVSMISYIAVVLAAGGAAVRDANGTNDTAAAHNIDLIQVCGSGPCQYGLHNDYPIMQKMAVYSILIYIGCFAATISTALTNLLTVPRLLKALGDDCVYPGLSYFAKEYGKNREPLRGYVLTFLVSAVFVLIGKLNAIAPLISNFYLASYALINFCTFHAALVRPLGWRPTFTCYDKWLSLVSCIICVVVMFFIDWISSVITLGVFFILYSLVMYRQPDVNWGSTTQAQLYKSTLASSYRLINVDEHVKNYQPHTLLLTGEPSKRPALLDLANLITKNSALLICGNVVTNKLTHRRRRKLLQDTITYLNQRKVKAFCSIVDGLKFEDGAKAIMQCCGIGKLRPNILMMGYKTDWMTSTEESLQTYFNLLHDAFDNRMAVTILRMPKSLEVPTMLTQLNGEVNPAFAEEANNSSYSNLNEIFSIHDPKCGTMPRESPCPLRRNLDIDGRENSIKLKKEKGDDNGLKKYIEQPILSEITKQMSIFSSKLKNGCIDVWWLYDDGGLTMLLPYILNTRSIWGGNKLRIFTLTNDKSQIKEEEQNMAALLDKFRIHYSSLKMLSDVEKPMEQETRRFFEDLIRPYRKDRTSRMYVSDEDLKLLEDKTNRQLRLRELLLEHSNESSLVVMSLPMPRKSVVSAAIYTAWLEVLTFGMPPFLLVRGNQIPVLTFYS